MNTWLLSIEIRNALFKNDVFEMKRSICLGSPTKYLLMLFWVICQFLLILTD